MGTRHSLYGLVILPVFITINEKNILVDPVFSGNAAPVSFFTAKVMGSNAYSADDFPELDVVLITHVTTIISIIKPFSH